jgi:hypothetical protein
MKSVLSFFNSFVKKKSVMGAALQSRLCVPEINVAYNGLFPPVRGMERNA